MSDIRSFTSKAYLENLAATGIILCTKSHIRRPAIVHTETKTTIPITTMIECAWSDDAWDRLLRSQAILRNKSRYSHESSSHKDVYRRS